MEQADQIIFLNFSRWNCLFRGWKRYRRYKGRVRESMAAGCPERFDWEFIRWILWDGRQARQVTRYRLSTKPIQTNLSLSRIKKSWMRF